MKTVTLFLLKFSVIAIAFTIIFRYLLSYSIDSDTKAVMVSTAIIYALSMFFLGWYWGSKAVHYLPVHDIGFRFHLATFLVHNGVSELWFALNFNSKYERVETIHMIAVYWSILLLFHFIFFWYSRKNSIDNLNKRDLFE